MLGEKYDSLKSRVRHAYNTEYNTDDEEEKILEKKVPICQILIKNFHQERKNFLNCPILKIFLDFITKNLI